MVEKKKEVIKTSFAILVQITPLIGKYYTSGHGTQWMVCAIYKDTTEIKIRPLLAGDIQVVSYHKFYRMFGEQQGR